ncbi:MAG TPA: VCBS repeat-containing protein, partial [Candidatus Saccharimonadales bacterium]|nr:VCBS repeat-containing protein [Candidatus Saccharimonadales bacterium]
YNSGGEEMNVSPTLYDLDGDGRDEILFTRGANLIALRGDGTIFWSSAVNSQNYVPNGGYQTVTNGFYWYPGGAFLPHLPANAVFSSQVSPPIVADLKGTGAKEIITGWKIDPDPSGAGQDYNPFIAPIFGFADWGTVGETWSGGSILFDALTGKQNFVYHIHQLVESGLAVGMQVHDRPLEVYVLNDSDSVVCFDRTQPHGLYGKGMLCKQFGKNQQLMSGSYQTGIDLQTVDLDGDGLDEVLVAGNQQSNLLRPHETILDDDGAILWRKWKPVTPILNNNGWFNSACMIPVNPDHDNHIDVLSFTHGYEIAFRYWNGIELGDRPGWPKSFYPLMPTPPVVGDVDGDGQEEIVIGTYNPSLTPSTGALNIYSLDGVLKSSIPVPGGIKHIPFLADVNGDGGLDVVFRSLAGQVYVYNFGATNKNLVSWSTHRGNKQRDGNLGRSLFPAGTPLIVQKSSGFTRAAFSWGGTATNAAKGFRVYRAAQPSGPFLPLATMTSNSTSYTDYTVQSGWQYFYEVGAIYSTGIVRSAPFAITPFVNSNLLVNGHFEENENSHWDKWFSGDIEATNMVASTNQPFAGRQSMEVRLFNKGNNNSISQFNQYGIPDANLPVTPGALYSFGGFFRSGGISQMSEHWLEWGSSKTGLDTNNRPPLPWPNYFTPHFKAGTAATPWLYANRVFSMPAGFPNVELRHRFTIAAPGSGSIFLDNLFFRPLPPLNKTNWISFVPFGAVWKFSTNAAAQWQSPTFDDRAWSSGQAKFGAGSGPTNIVTRVPQRVSKYFFRNSFVAPSTDYEELLLLATCTDDYGGTIYPLQVFLNGTEIQSAGIEAVSGQGNEQRYFDLAPFTYLLKRGTNTLAIQLNNTWAPDFDDVAFDVSLRGVAFKPVYPRFKSVTKEGAGVKLGIELPLGAVWQVESSDAFSASNWSVMSVLTNSISGAQTLWDTGQNGRPPPSNTGTRSYRIQPY